MIDLHVVSWNRPSMTKLVVGAIARNTKPGTYSIHVFDNNSDPETKQMLEDLYDNGLIASLDEAIINHGLEYARQVLFEEHAPEQYFICVDNDCLPSPMFADRIGGGMDWIEQLVGLMERYEDYAAISCRTQVMIGSGNIFEKTEDQDITEFPHPGGSLRIMRSSAVREVGGWSKQSSGRGSEEKYICGKLREAGYKTGFATHVPTLHLFGTRGEYETDRWGYDKDMKPEETGHSDIWHPALANGDDPVEIEKYAGKELTERYLHVDRSNQKV